MAGRRAAWTYPVAGFLGAWLLRFLRASWRVHEEPYRFVHARRKEREGPPGTIYLNWHSRILLAASTQAWNGTRVLVSQHGDGEYITRVIERLGFGSTIRGSTTRGGMRALIEVMRALEAGDDVAVTPDGPRGPRFRVQPGCVAAASRTGAAIVPIAFEASRRKRLRSWDRFMVPYPFAKVTVIAGDPLHVPRNLGPEGIGEWAARVESAMVELHRRAAEAVGVAPETADVDPAETRAVPAR